MWNFIKFYRNSVIFSKKWRIPPYFGRIWENDQIGKTLWLPIIAVFPGFWGPIPEPPGPISRKTIMFRFRGIWGFGRSRELLFRSVILLLLRSVCFCSLKNVLHSPSPPCDYPQVTRELLVFYIWVSLSVVYHYGTLLRCNLRSNYLTDLTQPRWDSNYHLESCTFVELPVRSAIDHRPTSTPHVDWLAPGPQWARLFVKAALETHRPSVLSSIADLKVCCVYRRGSRPPAWAHVRK